MAIKKSQIYKNLWDSCDELRDSMDPIEYKNYVLILLFVKYLSDKAEDDELLLEIPDGCRFSDFVDLKRNPRIGELINEKLEAIKEQNRLYLGRIEFPNFNDPKKLGTGKTMVDMLSNLIGVFEDPNLNFSNNRRANDDILGDAYEYLMKKFAVESGKSKGQFYTPAEVSRTMASVLHLKEFDSPRTTIYDMTCGSGSLLLRAFDETPNGATLYGQEKNDDTASLAILNMLLHGIDTAEILRGDTLRDPKFTTAGMLRTFDVCIANPPFSSKSWMDATGADDLYHRWSSNLLPPAKCGDYAFLLHLIMSMKPETGRGACILPHGVLFRGNAEQAIRTRIVRSGIIEGIIGLPPNIFYGTGIPACIIVLNNRGKATRKGIFFIDAKDGFMKDGPKNRLRQQDMRRIIDTWNTHQDVPHYARFVSLEEIERNDYNLNIPRYIAAEDKEIKQDIHAHLCGGLPKHDIDQMQHYWAACPTLRDAMFAPRDGGGDYFTLRPSVDALGSTIAADPSFISQKQRYMASIEQWIDQMREQFRALNTGISPKQLIGPWGESLKLQVAADNSLVNHYDAYGRVMDYWDETLQDDCYMISRDGWKAPLNENDKKKPTYKDLTCDLLPVEIVINAFFKETADMIQQLSTEVEQLTADMDSLVEENTEDLDEDWVSSLSSAKKYLMGAKARPAIVGEREILNQVLELLNAGKAQKAQCGEYIAYHADVFDFFEKVNKSTVKARLKEIESWKPLTDEALTLLEKFCEMGDLKDVKARKMKQLKKELTSEVKAKYDALTEAEIKSLVVEHKWLASLRNKLASEMEQVCQQMTADITALAERYAQTLPEIDSEVAELETKVNDYLKQMGF